jgi:hypothetical protein
VDLKEVPAGNEKKPLPVMLEVFKFGVFIVGFVTLLMLGTLGVHELGHRLAAAAFGCAHETTFGIGRAMTHVACDSPANTAIIIMGGLALTLAISIIMYFAGNDFTRRSAFLLLAFSIMTSFDDFGALGMPYYLAVLSVFASACLIGYGIMLIVSGYHENYAGAPARGKKALNP